MAPRSKAGPGAGSGADAVAALFEELAPDGRLFFRDFVGLFARCCLLTASFNHPRALSAFARFATGGEEPSLGPRDFHQAMEEASLALFAAPGADASLLSESLRVRALAQLLGSIGGTGAAARAIRIPEEPTATGLRAIGEDSLMRSSFWRQLEPGAVLGDERATVTLYSFSKALKALFDHYASSAASVEEPPRLCSSEFDEKHASATSRWLEAGCPPAEERMECPSCRGTGLMTVSEGAVSMGRCWRCAGEGLVRHEKEADIFLSHTGMSSMQLNRAAPLPSKRPPNRGIRRAGMAARSMYRLCRATQIVPDALTQMELLDILRRLSPVLVSPAVRAAQFNFFREERVLAGGEEQEWHNPPPTALNGEPRYSFPQFAELLAAVALRLAPRVESLDDAEVVEARLRGFLERRLGLPRDDELGAEGFAAAAYLEALRRDHEDDEESSAPQTPLSPSDRRRSLSTASWSHQRAASDFAKERDVFAALAAELPPLPPPRPLEWPAPEPGAKLHKQPNRPEFVDEPERVLQRPNPFRTSLVSGRPRSGNATKREREKKAKEKEKEKRSIKKVTRSEKVEKMYGGEIPWGQVFFYAKPEPKPTGPQPERRVDMLEQLEDELEAKHNRAAGMAGPAQGRPLGMCFIDEPLRGPQCPQCSEVDTLIENALTSRRLRNYDVAVAMLVAARRLWVSVIAGHTAPMLGPQVWREPPSPWDQPRGSASPRPLLRAEPEQPPRDPRREVIMGDRNAKPSLPMGVFRGGSSLSARDGKRDATARPPQALTIGGGLPGDCRYDPDTDFHMATGEGEDHSALLPEVALFFLVELASLHLALDREQAAARLLWRARMHSEVLPASHPDTAVVWCGLGRVSYLAGRSDLAARALLKARRIRERTLGLESIETATTYSNLACCMAALARPEEAHALLELAVEILRERAGDEHPRTLSARRNLDRAKEAAKHRQPEIPHLFHIPMRDPCGSYGKKKKGKKKGGSKSASAASSRASSRTSRGSKKGKSRSGSRRSRRG